MKNHSCTLPSTSKFILLDNWNDPIIPVIGYICAWTECKNICRRTEVEL